MISPSSVPSRPLPSYPFFLFFLAASPEDARVRVGVSGRGTTEMAKEAPPAWAVSNARKSGVLSSNTIPSRILTLSLLVLTWVGRKGQCKVLKASSGSSC